MSFDRTFGDAQRACPPHRRLPWFVAAVLAAVLGAALPSYASVTLSGTVYTDEGATTIGAGKTVRLLVAGASAGTAVTDAAGAYSITANPSPGDPVLVYLDGDDGATTDATTVTVSDGNALAGLDIYADHLIARHDNGGALTNALLKTAVEPYSDTEILYSVDAGNVLTVSGTGTELYVPAGHTYTPGGNVNSVHVKFLGTVNAGANTYTVSGNWDHKVGWFWCQTSTVNLTGTGSMAQRGGVGFYNLGMSATGHTTTLTTNVQINNVLTLGSGSLTGNYNFYLYAGNGAPLVDGGATISIKAINYEPSTAAGTITVLGGSYALTTGLSLLAKASNITFNLTGDVTVSGGRFTTGATNGTTGMIFNTNNHSITASRWDVGGASTTGSGTLNFGSSTIDIGPIGFRAQGGSHTINLQNTNFSTEGDWTVTGGSMAVDSSGGTSTVTFDSGAARSLDYTSGSFDNVSVDKVGGTLTLGSNLDVDGALTLTNGTLNAGAYAIAVAGNWANGATFNAGTSTVTLDGTGQSLTGSTSFYHLTKSVAAADTLTFTAGSTTTVAGTATLNGASGQLLSLRSSSAGSQWNLTLSSGASKAIDYVDVQDSDASGSDAALKPVNPANSTDSGNNADWFLPVVSGTVYTDEGTTNIGAGKTARLLVNGVSAGTGITDGSGAYSISASISAGDALLVFVDGDDGATTDATTITVADGSDLAGLDLYVEHLITRHDNGGAVTNALMDTALGAYSDIEILYSLDVSDNLTVSTGTELFVPATHAFTPGANVTTQGTAGNVDIRGTVTAGSSTWTVSGDWDSSAGTFNYDTSTVKMTGSGKTLKQSGGWATTLYNVTIGTGASVTLAGGVSDIANDITIEDNATLALTIHTFQSQGTASGNLTLGAGATFDIKYKFYRYVNDSSNHISTTGTITSTNGTGVFYYAAMPGSAAAPMTARNYDLDVAVASAADGVAVLGGGPSLNLGSHDLYLWDSGQLAYSYGTLDNSANIPVVSSGVLEIADQWDNATFTGKLIARSAAYQFGSVILRKSAQLDAATGGGASTWDVASSVTLNLGSTSTAGGSSWNVAGDWINNGGTFTAATSTLTLDGTGQSLTGSTSFYHLTKSVAAADTLTFAAGSTTTVAGTATLSGASGQLLSLRSATPGSAWNLTMSSGASKAISYVDVQDSNASGSHASLKAIDPANSTDSGNNVDWFSAVSGTVYTDEGTTNIGAGKTVRLLVNGASAGTTVTDGLGAYSISTALDAGDALLVYVDGDDGATADATTVTVSGGSDLAGLDLYVDRLITRHDNGGSLTNALLGTAKGAYSDTEILYTLDGSDNLTAESGTEIFVPGGHTYAPGADVTTQGSGGNIDVLGTLECGTSTLTVAGDWDLSNGSVAVGTSTVVMTGASAGISTLSAPGQFYNLTIQPGATVTAQTTFYLANGGVLTISGTLDIPAGNTVLNSTDLILNDNSVLSGAGRYMQYRRAGSTGDTFGTNVTISVATYEIWGLETGTPADKSVTGAHYGGDLIVRSSSWYATNYLYVKGGDLVVDGTLSIVDSWGANFTFVLDNSVENRNITAGALEVGNSAATNKYGQFVAGSGTITINGDVTLYASDGSGSNLIDAGSSTWTVAGDWSNSDTFTAGSSSVTLDGIGQSLTGSTSFYDLTKSVAAADTLTFAAGSTTTVGGTATLNGASGQLLSLVSGTPGTRWNLTLAAGASKAISSVDVADSDASGSDAALKPINPATSISSGNNVDWFRTVAGTVYTDEGTTPSGAGKTVRLLVNGVNAGTGLTDGTGAYSIAAGVGSGDAALVYLDGDDGTTADATTVTVADGSDLAGLDLYLDHLIVRHDNAGVCTNALMDTALGATADTEILYTVDASDNLTVGAGTELFVPSGHSFTPGADVTTQGAAGNVDIRGTVTAGANTFTVSGDWDSSNGTFASETSTLIMTGADKTLTTQESASWISAVLNNITVNSGASVTLQNNLSHAGALTISGTLTVPGGKTLWSKWGGASALLTVSAGGELAGAGAYWKRTHGNVLQATIDGTVSVADFTYTVWWTDSANPVLIPAVAYGGNLNIERATSNASDYAVLTGAGPLSVGGNLTLTAASGRDLDGKGTIFRNSDNDVDITISGDLILGDVSEGSSATLITGNAAISVGGAVVINDDAGSDDTTSIDASDGAPSITVSGNWTNNDSFTAGSSTVTFDGTSQSISGDTTFYNLTKSVVSADTLTFAAGSTTSVTGTATLGGASGQLLSLVSDTPGTRWNFTLASGASKAIDYVDVTDSDASGSDFSLLPIDPADSVDSGNNNAWFGVGIEGTVYSDEGTTPSGAGKTVRLLVNGASGGTAVTDASGAYSISAFVASGDVLLVYVDGDDGATDDATTVTVSDGGALAGLDLYVDHLILRHDNGGNLTNALVATAVGAYSDGEILCSVAGGILSVSGSGTQLYIPSGQTFVPGGDVTTHDLKLRGSLTGSTYTFTVTGDWDSSGGTFTNDTSTVVIGTNGESNSIRTPAAGGGVFYNVTIPAGATITVAPADTDGFQIHGLLTLSGTFEIPAGVRVWERWGSTITINAGGVLTGAGTFQRDVEDDPSLIVNDGTISVADFVYSLRGWDDGIIEAVTATTYGGNLTIKNLGSVGRTGVLAGTGPLVVAGTLTVYDDRDDPTIVFDNSINDIDISAGALVLGDASNPNAYGVLRTGSATITISSDLTIEASDGAAGNNILDASDGTPTIRVGGDWSNADTFTAGGSTVNLNGTGQTVAGDNTFFNLTHTVVAADTLTFAAGSTTSVTGTATLSGASGQLLSLVSGTPGTRWNFTLASGASKAIDYVDVADSDATASDASLRPINPANYVDSGNTLAWFPAPFSGTVYADEGTTPIGAGKTVRLLVNGVSAGTDVTDVNGEYSILGGVIPGDSVLVYLDGDDGSASDGTTVTVSDGVALPGLDLYVDHLIVRHDNGGSLTTALIDAAVGGYSDPEILTSVTSGNLTVNGTETELYVAPGHTFAPGGNVDTPHIKIRGILVGATHTLTVAGNWDSTGGAFAYDTSTVVIGTSGQSHTITTDPAAGWWGAIFWNLTIAEGASIDVSCGTGQDRLKVHGHLTVAGTLSIPAGLTFSLVYGNNALTIDPTGVLTGAGIFERAVDDSDTHIVNNGTIDVATFLYGIRTWSVARPVTATTYGGNLEIKNWGSLDWPCYLGRAPGDTTSDLVVSGTLKIWHDRAGKTLSLDNSVHDIDITVGGLEIGNTGDNTAYATFNAGSATVTVNGAVTIADADSAAANRVDAGSSQWFVAGNWSNGETFNADTSTVTLNGTGQTISGNTTFYNLTKSVAAADTLTFAAGSTTGVTGTATLNGAAGNLLRLRSSVHGTRWNFSLGAGAGKSLSFLDVKDSDASGSDASQTPLTPTDSFDSANNVDWFPSDSTPPAAITDLGIGTVSANAIALTWTAPGDDNDSGTAFQYDLRYATSPITDGNWASATPVTGEPAPAGAGSSESYNLAGLSASTTYYFAIKTADEAFNWSALSNCPGGTTTGGDDEPSTVALHPSGAAAGDEMAAYVGGTADSALDGNDGDSSYGLIDRDQGLEARLEIEDSATTGDIKSVQVKAVVRDMNGKSDDQMRLGLLIGGSEYWGPITYDVSGSYTTYAGTLYRTNPDTGATWSWTDVDSLVALVDDVNGQSNYRVTELYLEVGSYTPDVIAPDAIADLATGTVTHNSVQLTWTAPGDDASTGTASRYDVRYSTSAITDGNWDSATQASGEPAPQLAGSAESFTVTGLTAGVTYYFAVKSEDEVPNISALSNVVNVSTLVDHFRIEHPGSGLTCQRAEVTVKACQNATCSALVSESVSVTLSPTGWIGGSGKTITGGVDTFALRQTSSGTATLGIAGSTPGAANPTTCYVSGSPASCGLEFFDSGFVFDVPDLTSCEASASVAVRAVKKSDSGQSCVADGGFANQTKTLGFWSSYVSPASGTTAVYVNSTAVGTSSPGTGISLSFDGSAQSSFTVRYDDAGQVQLDTRYQGSGEDTGLVMLGSDTFGAAPHHFTVSATTDGSTPLHNSGTSGSPSWKAGETFQVQVQAACADDSVTPNFAWDTSLSAAAPFAPSGGSLGSLGGSSILAASFSGGSATATSVTYSEVGSVTLQADATDYLGLGLDVTGTSATVGRFTPDHFDLSFNSPSFQASCVAGGFTYIGQPFTYATVPVITVTARNKAGDTTENYSGAWWKITDSSVNGKTYSTASGTLDTGLVPSPDPVIVDGGSGTGTLTFSDGGGIAFVRNTPVAAFDADISLAINVVDADGISYGGNPARFGSATAGNGIAFGGGKQMLFGRITLENAYGSELLSLDIPLVAEVYNGSVFTTNTLDSCTSLSLPLFSLTSEVETVAADNPITVKGTSTSTTTWTSISAGAGALSFSSPNPANEGYVDIAPDLSSLYWLRYDWDGDSSHDDAPTGRATFGLYRGQDEMIFIRESILQ